MITDKTAKSNTSLPTDFADLLSVLWRAGKYGYLWDAKTRKTEWLLLPSTIPDCDGEPDIFFGVHPCSHIPPTNSRGEVVSPTFVRGQTDYIAAVNCFYAEYDSKQDLTAAISDGPLPPPSVAIQSSERGIHAYWLLDKPYIIDSPSRRDAARHAQHTFVQLAQSDPNAKDLTRHLRVPGTINGKYDPPQQVRFLWRNMDQTHTWEEITSLLPPLAPAEPPSRSKIIDSTLIRDAIDALSVLAPWRVDDYNEWLEVGMALSELGETGLHLWDDWSKGSEKYNADTVKKKWATFEPGKGLSIKTLFYKANQDRPIEQEEGRKNERVLMTDLGNARRLRRNYGENVMFIPAWNKWYVWNNRYWSEDATEEVMRVARAVVDDMYEEASRLEDKDAAKALRRWAVRSESLSTLKAMVTLARSEEGIARDFHMLDLDGMLLNCVNGTLDLRTGILHPHRRDDLITRTTPTVYDPNAQCPTWETFLDRIMEGDKELIRFIQKAVGYSLTASTEEQVLFFMYGSGANGKSTFIETIMAVLGQGSYTLKAPTEMIMVREKGSIPNDVAQLPGMRMVVVAEVEEGRRIAESVVKDHTGKDTITARFMRGEWFRFVPSHKLWMYGNHKPIIRGTDTGIWRRVRLIPFTVSIPPAEQDKSLSDKLMAELPGILNWAVEGCKMWQEEGLGYPTVVAAATANYKNEMDTIGTFIDELCIVGPKERVRLADLYDTYRRWTEVNGEHTLRASTFKQKMVERGFEKKASTANQTYWVGISLNGEGAVTLKGR